MKIRNKVILVAVLIVIVLVNSSIYILWRSQKNLKNVAPSHKPTVLTLEPTASQTLPVPNLTKDDVRINILKNFYDLLSQKDYKQAYEISSKNRTYNEFVNTYSDVKYVLPLNFNMYKDNEITCEVEIDGNIYEANFEFDDSDKIVRSNSKLTYQNSNEVCNACGDKPVIYLYPEKIQDTTVELLFDGTLLVTYPEYNRDINGWDVTAHPNGTLFNKSDGKEYSYLFWEGRLPADLSFNLSEGFVVEGEKTAEFLQNILPQIGLKPSEYNEFIVYWLPRMKNNKYNLIHFASEEYENIAKLNISPEPDSVLRVFMVFKHIEQKVEITPQYFSGFERKGFTVVEWGGTELH